MSMFDPSELAELRTDAAASFDEIGSIWNPTNAKNNAGGVNASASSYTISASNVPMHVRRKKREPTEGMQAGMITGLARWEVIMPYTQAIGVKSRINVGGYWYEVLNSDSGKSFSTKTICDCMRVNDGAV